MAAEPRLIESVGIPIFSSGINCQRAPDRRLHRLTLELYRIGRRPLHGRPVRQAQDMDLANVIRSMSSRKNVSWCYKERFHDKRTQKGAIKKGRVSLTTPVSMRACRANAWAASTLEGEATQPPRTHCLAAPLESSMIIRVSR